MRKMDARSLPELGRMTEKLQLVLGKPQYSGAAWPTCFPCDGAPIAACQLISCFCDVILLGALQSGSQSQLSLPNEPGWIPALGKHAPPIKI
jgi:hypothetical protein